MISRRSFSAIGVALLISAGFAAGAKAKDETPGQFLQSIYAAYMGSNSYGVRWRGPKSGQYFDPALTKLISKDLKESGGEVGRIGADPFVDAQDFEIESLRVDVTEEPGDKAKAVVTFVNLSQPVRVEYALVKTPQGWRIADIRWQGRKESFRSLLSGPL
jgi:hypothetical protein